MCPYYECVLFYFVFFEYLITRVKFGIVITRDVRGLYD